MTEMRDLRTKALVLKRTNYGETDRILNVLTPEGKIAVLAKGVRKEKSRLAGGIEMFSLSEIVVHSGKGELMVLTAAKMVKFYQKLISDYARMEAGAEVLKRISKAAEAVDSPEFFALTRQTLEALNSGFDISLILAWFYLNLARVSGEQVNLYTDVDGGKLVPGERYVWDTMEKALRPNKQGPICTDEIKMLRLMLSAELKLIVRVKMVEPKYQDLLYIARSVG